jgi:DNA-binding NarL/FixJ family response regulator
MCIGVKELRPATVETLVSVNEACPRMAMVLLFSVGNDQAMKSLREFSRAMSVGRAYLPKHTIDTTDQLEQVVHSVAQGMMIIDPSIMERLLKTQDSLGWQLKDLSPKALEVLHWLAKGYKNESIAQQLSRDTKTIERHINNIYSHFEDDEQQGMHPRVRAALLYLRAVGQITAD